MAANNLSYQFKTANIAVKIIVINVAVFLLARVGAWVIGSTPSNFMSWFVLPADIMSYLTQFWSILTYSFLHFDFFHILWNMLILYWFSQFVLNLFNEKRFLTIYLLGAICGGILFLTGYNLFPVLANQSGFLIGASAGVLAIVVFIATYTPNAEVRIFMFTLKLWHIALFMVLRDLISLPTSGNAGGLIAHMGGALLGYIYALQLRKGIDIGSGFEKAIDAVGSYFTPKPKSPLKTVHRKPKTTRTTQTKQQSVVRRNKTEQQKRIDEILDKISTSGYESLSKQEKDFLFKAGKE
ncbi:rhomboid family intramembrane serine protease [Aquimarina sp. ERC-38]|uniref:rhomboid family intramembrane serine protease n=1 Tax=Aquimarina sp. ERC-38 TaxID=2949996 RepID=UPI002247358C|nr:rhomboid family intramembrane serine protease [Aquimarina sp. ERC-38]UZO79448.1 rhomboid family intramembrane serine protease [Aquimarina sp. ERC-38]